MPDENDDQHIVLNFQPRPKSRSKSRSKFRSKPIPMSRREAGRQAEPEDIVASGAVVLALVAAVAIVSGWVPVDRYGFGIVAGLAVLAAAAKLIKARR